MKALEEHGLPSFGFAHYGEKVWGVKCDDKKEAAREGIEKTVSFFKEIGMPVKLREFGIDNKSAELAELCTFNGARTIKSYVEIDRKIAKEIFESCY